MKKYQIIYAEGIRRNKVYRRANKQFNQNRLRSYHLDSWKDIWEKKGKKARCLTLRDLINVDGFDKGNGKMTKGAWLKTAEVIARELDLKARDYLLEIGCGSGAMLLPLSERGIKIAGIDYSKYHITIARRTLPSSEFIISEANVIPFIDNTFSKILSHSVFHYFPDLDYATVVLLEMIRVLRTEGKALIMDIPDLVKQQRNSNPPHLHYSKAFFTDFAQSKGLNCKVFNQRIKEYGNTPFRFNVLLG